MASCTNWFRAEDQDGNFMRGGVKIYEWSGGSWVWLINKYIDAAFGVSTTLTDGNTYKAVSDTDHSGYITPRDQTWTACDKDITLVYKKIICTPGDLKCVGDDVYRCDSDGVEWDYVKNCPHGCSDGACIEEPIGNGFTIQVSNSLVDKTLLVAHVTKMPFIGLVGPDPNLWYWPQVFDYVGGKWYMAEPATKYRLQVGSVYEAIPSFDKTYGTGSFADGIHCVVLAEGESGVNTLLFKGEDVFQLHKNSPTEIYLSATSNDVISEALLASVCDWFDVSDDDCALFTAEMCSDPVFVHNQLLIITDHTDIYGEDHPPEWYDYPLLGLGIFGILSPGICEGALLKSVGKKISGLIETVKKIPGDFTEARHGKLLDSFLRGDGNRISTLVDAYKAQDWTAFDAAYDAITSNPIALMDQLGRARRWVDEIYKRGYGKSSIDDVALRPLERQMGLIVDYLATPLRYRFIKPDNLEVIEELFEAGLRNAARRETLTATESASIIQMAYNNPDCFVQAVGNLPSSEYSSLLSVLGKSGATTEKALVEEAMTLLTRPDLFPKFSYLSAIIAHHPLAVLTGSSDEIAEALIREFPTLTGERVLAEMSLLDSHFKTHYPGVVDAAVDNLAITKGWSSTNARKVIEDGKLGWVIKDRIISVPRYAIEHPILVVEGIIAWYMGGIAPMWFVEEVPQGYSIQVYTFIKREEYDLARDQLVEFKNILEAIENDILPTAKFLFPMWAVYMDTAMDNHWDQYNGYARLLGVVSISMPEVKESVPVYVDEIKNANTFYTGIDPNDTWRENIDEWVSKADSNSDPDVPILYQATFTEVFVAEGEHYEPQQVRRQELGGTETRWSVGGDKDKTLHNAIIEWQRQKIEGKKLTLLSDVNCQWDDDNRIKACVKSGSSDLNKDLIIKGYAAIWFLGCPSGTAKNKQINYTTYASEETAAKALKLGIWAESVKTGTVKCTSNQVGFSVYIDDVYINHSYGNTYLIVDDVEVGIRTVKIEKGTNYTPEYCEETIGVSEDTQTIVDCQMIETGDCSEVTDVSIYLDPLSPVEGETVSFNGDADSDDPILADGWDWDFGDRSPNKVGQAVTHTYSSDGIYTVKLTVTNECDSSRYTTRNITVSEEEPPTESTTLQIETPIDEDGNEIDRYWDVEIWVDGKYTACDPPHTLTFGTGVHCDCTSPWDLVDCELGTHTITLKKAGYDDKTISVYLKKDEPKTWHSPVMVKSAAAPTMHTIRFSVPEGSNLHIDGVSLSRLSTVTRISELFKSMRK